MNLFGAVFGGLVAGLIGAAVWCGIAYFTGYEIGWIAWGIGALVGFGTLLGAQEGRIEAGLIAVVISLAAIAGGKYATVELMYFQAMGDSDWLAQYENEGFIISYLADDALAREQEAGRTLDYPAGADLDMPDGPEDYPARVWATAESEWDAMTIDEQTAFREEKIEEAKLLMGEFHDAVVGEGFVASFGFMDLLFGALAVFTAFKIGSGLSSAEA